MKDGRLFEKVTSDEFAEDAAAEFSGLVGAFATDALADNGPSDPDDEFDEAA